MRKVNFNSFRNLQIPETWIEEALSNSKCDEKPRKKPIVFSRRTLSFAMCLIFVCALCVALFFYFNNDINLASESLTETQKASEKNKKSPFLLQANSSDDFGSQTQNESQVPFENGKNATPDDFEFSTGNVCTAKFSQGLLVGEKKIYCVLYDYTTGELMGDENLLSDEHLAEIECLDDGMVNASYDPLKNKVVKRAGEYWYVFYNELIMSPIQGYIYIYI